MWRHWPWMPMPVAPWSKRTVSVSDKEGRHQVAEIGPLALVAAGSDPYRHSHTRRIGVRESWGDAGGRASGIW
jgi:hypothetical protein